MVGNMLIDRSISFVRVGCPVNVFFHSSEEGCLVTAEVDEPEILVLADDLQHLLEDQFLFLWTVCPEGIASLVPSIVNDHAEEVDEGPL